MIRSSTDATDFFDRFFIQSEKLVDERPALLSYSRQFVYRLYFFAGVGSQDIGLKTFEINIHSGS